MLWIGVLLLAVAISMDGFGAGLTYGMREIKIPIFSRLVVSLASALTFLVSLLLGEAVASWLSQGVAEWIGALTLMLLGVWVIWQSHRGKVERPQEEKTLLAFRIGGLVIRVLRYAPEADLDHSGTISTAEAGLLGVALALDAGASGMAAAMAGYPVVGTTLAAGVSKFALLTLGLFIGSRWSRVQESPVLRWVPGGILFFLGVSRLV